MSKETRLTPSAYLCQEHIDEDNVKQRSCSCLPLPEPPSDDCPLHGEADWGLSDGEIYAVVSRTSMSPEERQELDSVINAKLQDAH